MKFYGQIKIGEYSHSHTKTMPDGSTIDVLKLIKLLNDSPTKITPLDKINSVSRSKRSGFSQCRYDEADTTFPLLVTEKGHLLDGRHRYYKLLDSGNSAANTRVVSKEDIKKVTL